MSLVRSGLRGNGLLALLSLFTLLLCGLAPLHAQHSHDPTDPGGGGAVDPCLEPFCIPFEEGIENHNFTGYLPCQFPNPGVSIFIASPGASGALNDFYLHARDLPGASIIQNFTDFSGDWTCLARKGCAEFCFDFRLFIDGQNNGSLNITPSFVILSDPDGPCGPIAPLRAQFIASFTVTEDGGTNSGWHRICAPIQMLQNGQMPANASGTWQMLDGAPNSDWHTLLANVTAIQFPIDFTSNPAEEVGYDNFCIVEEDCADCLEFGRESVECVAPGSYSYSVTITNMSSSPIKYLALMDLPSGVTVSPGPLLTFATPLPPGASTNITLSFQNVSTNELCFLISALTEKLDECCTLEFCIQLPTCCALISDECIICDPEKPNTYQYTFTYQNLTTNSLSHLFLVPDSDCYSTSSVMFNPPLAPGQSTNVAVTITQLKADCPPRFCILFSTHDKDFHECCAFMHCVELPVCCNGKTYTLDADFDEGTMLNVTYDPVSDQLQFDKAIRPFPYVNIPASARGTVIRIDVNTGAILGEYLSSPNGMAKNPSRTTVDKYGNVWVSNRDEFSNNQGSVMRIALIIGGSRVDAAGNPDPNGLYLKPPFLYNSGAVDRDGDGLIKTSRGLGDILPWSNPGNVDSNGGVTSADDELIINYTRVNGTGTRTVAVDANNDVWVGGLGNRAHEKLDGVTGLPIPGTQFNVNSGGYGGLIDKNGNLWSANGLIRFDPNLAPPPAGVANFMEGPLGGSYGLGIDPCSGNIWVTDGRQGPNYILYELDPNTGAVVSSYPQPFWAQGVAVDQNGHVWVAEGFGSRVWHLAPNPPGPHLVVGMVTGLQGVTGLAVDSNGKIWAAELSGNRASRIDPALAAGVGAIDLSVNLGAGAQPYNYSDMTGFVAIGGTSQSGSWTVVHDGGAAGLDWGTISWNSSEPAGTSITVEARAADSIVNLAALPFRPMTNGVNFCGAGVIGRYLEVRVNFTKPSCKEVTPVLFDLTIDCCAAKPCGDVVAENTPPQIKCPDPVQVCLPDSNTVTLNGFVHDADGNALEVIWHVNGNPVQTNIVNSITPPTSATVTLTYTFPVGSHSVVMVVSDGRTTVKCETKVSVGDQEKPFIQPPQGLLVTNFAATIPDFTRNLVVADDCTPNANIKVTQSPAAGTAVKQGNYLVTLLAVDNAGRSNSVQTFVGVQPVVRLLTPRNYTAATQDSSIELTAALTAELSGIREVRFLSGDEVIGVDAQAPYSMVWQKVPVGTHTLTAQAVDAQGNTSTSAKALVFVSRVASPPEERPQIMNAALDGGFISFGVQPAAGQIAEIQFLDPATGGTWQELQRITGDGSYRVVRDAISNSTTRLYRMRVQ